MTEKNVLDYGVKGDGAALESTALQALLDEGGYIYIPAGKYRIDRPLILSSHTHLRAHPEAFLFSTEGFGVDKDSFLLTNRKNAEDIWVDGGIWNGNADGNPRKPSSTGDAYLGVMIQFTDMNDLHLKNMTVQDSESFHIRLNYVKRFTIEDITIEDTVFRVTQDGIHIAGGCEDGEIARIKAIGPSCSNDDMIALITDLTYQNMMPTDPSLGERFGPIRRIKIHDIYADNTFSFLRLMSNSEPLEDISVTNVRGGCYYLAVQMQITPYMRLLPEYQSPKYFGVGNIRNIRLSDFYVYYRMPFGYSRGGWGEWILRKEVNGLIDLEQSVYDLTIENFHRDLHRDYCPTLPTFHVKNMRNNHLTYHVGENAAVEFSDTVRELPAYTGEDISMKGKDMLCMWGDIHYLHFYTEDK